MAPLASTAAVPSSASACESPQLASLQRKPSSVVNSLTTPLATKTPLLQPVALSPERCRVSTIPLEFLSTIARIEINETRVRDGVTYYVLDVFRHHFDTRLPARLNDLRHQVSQKTDLCVKTTDTSFTNATPDYRVEHRFSDFSLLRAQVYEAASLEPQFRCAYCDEFIVYVRFRSQQPRSLAKLTTGTRSRKAMLAAFMNDLVRMAQWQDLQNRRCESHHRIPEFLAQFLQQQQQQQQQEEQEEEEHKRSSTDMEHGRSSTETELSLLLGSPFSSPRS